MTTFDSAATLDAIAVLQHAKQASARTAPESVWRLLMNAQSRLDQELIAYLRGTR